MTPDLWADSAASLFAALGLLIVLRRIGAAGPGPLTARFRAALGLLATLMAVRVAGWTTGLGLFDGLTVALAGAVPLAAVALTEGLLRRHAPPALKWLALAGTLAFAVTAVLPPAVLPTATRGLALMLYQLTVLVSLGVLVLARDRSDLAAEENRAIDRMLASLALILPLLAGDFRTAGLDLPIRTAPIAILGLAWLSLGLGHATSKARHLAAGFAGVLALSAAVAGTLAGGGRAGPARHLAGRRHRPVRASLAGHRAGGPRAGRRGAVGHRAAPPGAWPRRRPAGLSCKTCSAAPGSRRRRCCPPPTWPISTCPAWAPFSPPTPCAPPPAAPTCRPRTASSWTGCSPGSRPATPC
jgi:hypothetical protein